MGYRELLEEISSISNILCNKGWAEKNAGNLSIDVTDVVKTTRTAKLLNQYKLKVSFPSLKERIFLVTPSGSRFRDLAKSPEKYILHLRITSDGGGYVIMNNRQNQRPTSELISHLMIHNYLREKGRVERVVLHTHPTELITLSHLKGYQSEDRLNKLLISAHPEVYINLPHKIGFVRYILTGSTKLAEETLKAIRRGRTVIIWERHGVVSIGRDLSTAFDHIDIANKAALIAITLFQMNKKPILLNNDELSELQDLVEGVSPSQ